MAGQRAPSPAGGVAPASPQRVMSDDRSPFFTRRHVVAGAAGLAGSLAAPRITFAMERDLKMTTLINPADKYPGPPFKKQSQPWPGLAGKMDPQPDHGEKSYR